MIQEELTKEDKDRVLNCDYYQLVKNIMKSHETYKNFKVGDVFFIKYNKVYVSRIYGGKRDKFMVFYKDENDFVFIKRINANGKLGKEVQCLTTQYPSPTYEIEPDPEYLDSILFENESEYDPLKAEKELNKLKSRARRKNKKLELIFDNDAEAFNAIKQFKVGDVIYDTKTTYGEGIMEWTVTKVIKRKTDYSERKLNSWSNKVVKGATYEDSMHVLSGLSDFCQIDIECKHEKPKSRKYSSKKRTINFSAFKKYGNIYYKSKPYTIDDVQ